jgi:tetratricopeptide (TPR) repeat protein
VTTPTLDDLVVEVLCHWSGPARTGWSVGSGFLIRDGYVLTAAHNVGPGEITVRTGKVERPAEICLSGEDAVDIALLKLTEDAGRLDGFRSRSFGTVDRDTAAFVDRCLAIGFPRFKERATVPGRQDQGKPFRLSAQVGGRIPTGENLGTHLLTLHVGQAPQPLTAKPDSQSQWSGMSGAVVFADQVVIGVITEHHRPEGDSSLTVVPITAIGDLSDAAEWWRLLEVNPAGFPRLPVREAPRPRDRMYVWTAEDSETGMRVRDDIRQSGPFERNERVSLTTIRQGRLPHLQRDFRRLAEAFETWLIPDSIKRGEPLRVFWIAGEPGHDRSMGLLACLSRAAGQGRDVYDAIQNLPAGAAALSEEIGEAGFGLPPVIVVDLRAGEHTESWEAIRDALNAAGYRYTTRSGEHLRGVDPYPRLVIAGATEQENAAYRELMSDADIQPYNLRGMHTQSPHSFHGASRMASLTLTDDDVYNRGLPITTDHLVGREDELEELDAAWASKAVRIAFVVAQGGAGKSALINTWLNQMRENDYRKARKVFAWSFYSQGTKENLVAADPFVSAAMAWLGGDDVQVSVNPSERGHQLAALVRQHKLLLVLDGIEPLQYPLSAPHVGGQFTDESLRALLGDLAEPGWDGMCLITTRVPLTDLDRFSDTGAVVRLDLENLAVDEGAYLLQELIGRKTPRRELREAVTAVDGHALAVTLLGNYIRDVHDGDLNGRFDIGDLTVSAREGGHARRIMASYTDWLEHHGQVAQLAVLRLIGLFDRPAPPEAMGALLADAAMAPYTGHLRVIGDGSWDTAVGDLRKMGLLNRPILEWPGTIDAHPLVREHFREVVRSSDPDIWMQGNRTLFGFYQDQAPERPSTSAEMSQMYAAVTHGCASELYQEVFDQVLLPRVWRDRRTNFSTRRLGMTGSDLVALSNYFFPRRWDEIRRISLAPRARVLVLTNAGVRLRQLGRLVDARECFGAVAGEIKTEVADPEELEDASYAAAQNCELLVIAGKLQKDPDKPDDTTASAEYSAQRAIEYSSRGLEPYFSMHAHSTLGEVYFMLGKTQRAGELFEQARSIDQDRRPRPPFLYSQGLFRYGYYLIETHRAGDLLSDADATPSWGKNGEDSSLLSEAIRILILGAAHRALIEADPQDRAATLRATAENLLDQAINAFKYAGYSDYTARGLLERAHFYRARGGAEYYRKALRDLDDATIETDRGQMDILYADVLLQRAACYLSYWRTMTSPEREGLKEQVQATLNEAARKVKDLDYGRRRGMLAGLQESAREFGI